MTSTVFTDFVTPVPASWLNDVNTSTYTTVPANTVAIAVRPTSATLAAAGGATLIGNTPAGNIAATNVQAALNELDTEKALLAGSAAQVFSVGTATAAAHAPQASQLIGRNLVVNGSRAIDQVNGGALTTPVTTGYPIDNVQFIATQASKLQAQQVAASATLLGSLGAVNALSWSVLASYTPVATDEFAELNPIEGINWARMRWGTANALPLSIQFKVRASVAGTYSGAIQNAAGNRSYPFSFTLAANTDTLVKVENIPGDTAGTWPTTNVTGAYLLLDLGSGANFKSTAGSWQAGNYVGVTGAIALVAQINGSTLSDSDLQAEQSTFCSTFERNYAQDDWWCRRYLPVFTMAQSGDRLIGVAQSPTTSYFDWRFPVPTRVPVTSISGLSVTTPSTLNVNQLGTSQGNATAVSMGGGGSTTIGSFNVTTTAGSPTLAANNGVTLSSTAVGGAQIVFLGSRI